LPRVSQSDANLKHLRLAEALLLRRIGHPI
jgi:hypothetical protein